MTEGSVTGWASRRPSSSHPVTPRREPAWSNRSEDLHATGSVFSRPIVRGVSTPPLVELHCLLLLRICQQFEVIAIDQ